MKILLVVVAFIALPNIAAASSVFNHPLLSERPVSFWQETNGDFSGVTEFGTTFTQRNVANNYSIALHKFSIGEVSFYVSERGVIEAANDTIALSIYFARG